MINNSLAKDFSKEHLKSKIRSLVLFDKLYLVITTMTVVALLVLMSRCCINGIYWPCLLPSYKLIIATIGHLYTANLRLGIAKKNYPVSKLNAIVTIELAVLSVTLSSMQQVITVLLEPKNIGAYMYFNVIIVVVGAVYLMDPTLLKRVAILAFALSTIDFVILELMRFAYIPDAVNLYNDMILLINNALAAALSTWCGIKLTSALKTILATYDLQTTQLQKYKTLSETDELTTLSSRRAFELDLDALAHVQPGHVAIVMFDIDHFKQFNDTYGHQTGDIVLRRVSKLIKIFSTQIGVETYRYGGEELAVVFSNNEPLTNIIPRLEAFRKAVSDIQIADVDKRITISGGLAVGTLPTDISETEYRNKLNDLIALADKHLYHAKDAGRDRLSYIQCNFTDSL